MVRAPLEYSSFSFFDSMYAVLKADISYRESLAVIEISIFNRRHTTDATKCIPNITQLNHGPVYLPNDLYFTSDIHPDY